MKAIVVLLILALSSMVVADEVTVDIDRITLLTPNQNDMETESSRIAVFFDIPDSLDEKHIVYAEIAVELDLSNLLIEGSRTLELQAYDITSDWTEQDTWNTLAEAIDTLGFYTYTFEISNDSRIFMDVTNYVKSVTNAGNANFGIMLIPHKFDQWVFHVSQSVVNQIQNNASVRIVYH